MIRQDAVIAGSDDIVISKLELSRYRKDLKIMGKELRGQMAENAELKTKIEELEKEKKRAEEVKEEKRTEIRDLSERLIERIKKL